MVRAFLAIAIVFLALAAPGATASRVEYKAAASALPQPRPPGDRQRYTRRYQPRPYADRRSRFAQSYVRPYRYYGYYRSGRYRRVSPPRFGNLPARPRDYGRQRASRRYGIEARAAADENSPT